VAYQDELSELVARTALRDRAAFAALYARSAPKLFGVALRILKDRGEAEDALQEIYVKIWHKADRFAGSQGSSGMAWLCAIARNHAIDVLRARRPVADPIGDDRIDLVDLAPDPEQTCLLRGEGRRIDRCMQELDSARAGAVRSAYVEGLSYQELAERHDVPLNTMRTWLRRSLLKLRECMDR
jgi:RNA polymerase sigma-70 factor (ECF subfamily)